MSQGDQSEVDHPVHTVDLPEIRETYYEATGKASDIVRQLAFAGLAFVWVFSGASTFRSSSVLHIPSDLLRVGLVLVVALVIDLLQYLWRSAAFGVYGRWVENRPSQYSAKFKVPDSINRVNLGLFWGKAVALMVAYVLLALALAQRIQ